MGPVDPGALEALVARIDATSPTSPAPDTVPSGFPSLDRMLGGGFRRQDLIVLGGDVASGKSALALAMAIRSALAGVPTAFLSGEMSPERVMERALAMQGKVPVDDLRLGRLDIGTRAAVGAAAVRLREVPLHVWPLHPGGPSDLTQALRHAVPSPRLVLLDSLEHFAPRDGRLDLEERRAIGVPALKAAAVEADVALVAVAELPQFQRGRADDRPTLDDLGARGTLKHVPDLVLQLYREEMYRPGQGVEGATELVIAKNRNGATGFVDLYFYPRWLRFEDLLDR